MAADADARWDKGEGEPIEGSVLRRSLLDALRVGAVEVASCEAGTSR